MHSYCTSSYTLCIATSSCAYSTSRTLCILLLIERVVCICICVLSTLVVVVVVVCILAISTTLVE